MSLDTGYWRYWGKADSTAECNTAWHPLIYHSLDVAACGQVLMAHQPAWLQKLSQLSEIHPDQLFKWLSFLLVVHDAGKFGAGFQSLRPDIQAALQGNATAIAYETRHDTLGYALLMDSLPALLGRDPTDDLETDLLQPWTAAVAGHHGRPPQNTATKAILARHFPTDTRGDVEQFIQDACHLLAVEWCLPEPAPGIAERLRRASWLVAGLAVVSDWLGSNRHWFEYRAPTLLMADYWEKIAIPTAKQAVADSGLSAPAVWERACFAGLFPRLADRSTPLQAWSNEVAIAPKPQLFILEELTGGGKTEAGLTLAARLLSERQGAGVYFALPTMATADAMLDRLCRKDMDNMRAPWQRFFADGQVSLILAHSAASTKAKLDSLKHRDAGYDEQAEEPSASQHSSAWLSDSRKKALLADFGVGTIDQALLGILPLRHQSLRLLGLSTKVLIVDEVHACDCYMGELLQRLLRFHAAHGGSAILLSATLPIGQRERLLNAFAAGAGYPAPVPADTSYPLATHLHATQLDEAPIRGRDSVSRFVSTDPIADEGAVHQRLTTTLQRGLCCAWVRNTVADAVDAWHRWNAEHPESPATLFHARFALHDRLAIAEAIERRFGPDGTATSRQGQVVIATQVIEQSLDVDFDDMVSDLAPIDLVVQRAGRLQRHIRNKDGNRCETEGRGGARFGVLMPEPGHEVTADWYKDFLPKAACVYPDHGKLWLTAHWLMEHGGFDLATQARDLIESVYGDAGYDRTPESLQVVTAQAEGQCHADRGMARMTHLSFELGYDPTSQNWPDEDEHTDITTRLGEKTVRLRLARLIGDRLEPWADADPSIAWPLSELTVPRRLAAGESERHAELIEQARASMPDAGRYCLILPLEPIGTDWQGWAMDQQDNEIRLLYSAQAGLSIATGDVADESDL